MSKNFNNLMAKVAVNKSILKEFHYESDDRVVYLNNGDEFQIQLFNPNSYTIGAEISIDGNLIPGIIVIKPGERHWIERPMNNNRKFKFETYEVEDTAAVSNAIAKNGVIEIKFYKERINRQITYKEYEPITYVYNYNDCNNYYKGSSNCLGSSVSTTIDNGASIKLGLTNPTDSLTISNIVGSLASDVIENRSASEKPRSAKGFTHNVLYNSVDSNVIKCNAEITSNSISLESNSNMLDFECNDTLCCDNIQTMETGRISKGSVSDQEFKNVDINFEYWPYETETIKILPMSRKPYNSSDLKKVYCTNCGRKLNTKYKFCPFCGHKCELFD